jgi:hypothetical protein
MIEKEILEITTQAHDSGDLLNEKVDEFRLGRDLNDIMILLKSSNSELVAIGAWILGELDFELYNSQDYIHRLKELTDHEDPSVRFHALGALFPALSRDDTAAKALLTRLRNDRNEGVRKSAEAAAARLSLLDS